MSRLLTPEQSAAIEETRCPYCDAWEGEPCHYMHFHLGVGVEVDVTRDTAQPHQTRVAAWKEKG